ncbi:PAS domain-containing sensor histidine kinase [Halobacterium jilantaiense]|uniref:PAS domain-containing sensor histidine kinase n=1 Tax=Halobacterium jilantaiense TaxID=355548 RepID=UPI001FE13684|nr:PAS domain-containing sensor histidine kinase [Halobacterium jilantaiense]
MTSGTITYVSQSAENVLGFEPSELTGENVVSYIHPDDQAKIAQDLSEYVDDYGYTGTYRVRVRDSNGEWRVFEARAANLLDDPFVEGIVLNSRDVTEKQRRKRKLERQNERLDQFASIVAHDLRNPLNVAVGRLDLLAENVDGDQADTVDTIQRQLGRIEDIIEDSLALAQSGEIVTETDEVDLGAVAREAWANVDTGEASLAVGDAVRLSGDRHRLLNMFENLFRNSVEHNEPTDLTVRVSALPDEFGFYVEDSGTGIPAEEREKAFERGYTTNRDGTGFGLAIVQDIVQAHGWEVSLSDGADGGARFEVACDAIPLEQQTELA